MRRNRVMDTLAVATLTLGALCPGTSASTDLPGDGAARMSEVAEPLDYAFRFATAIQDDDEDRAKAQHAVVRDLIATGALEAAEVRGAEIGEAGRRGLVYAALAGARARGGDVERARELLAAAQEIERSIEGWQRPKLTAEIADVLALLRDPEGSTARAEALREADPRSFTGRAAATLADLHARNGEFELAMQGLDSLEGHPDVDVARWRTQGYLGVARVETLQAKQRRRALRAARRSAEHVAGTRAVDLLREIAIELHRQGHGREAAEAMDTAAELMDAVEDHVSAKAVLMTTVARGYASIDRRAKATELLARAEPLVLRTPALRRPQNYAYIAMGYQMTGSDEEAARLYDKAFEWAEGLQNHRPRMLAVLAICRAMGQEGWRLDRTTRSRLDRLLDAPPAR